MSSVPLKKRYKRLHSKLKGESQTDAFVLQEDRKRAWKLYHTTREVCCTGLAEARKSENEDVVRVLEKLTKRCEFQCPICFESMTENLIAACCSHLFHSACLNTWLEQKKTCPVCRVDIKLDSCHSF